MRTVSLGVIAVLLIGCAKGEADGAPVADAGAAEIKPTKDNACSLLSMAEVRRVLPDAARTKRNDNLTDQGIAGCGWYAATGKAPLLEVSVWDVSGADDTPMENARTLAMGIADPMRQGAEKAVRLETVTGVGEEAVALVEKSDAARGILTTGALLSLRQNGRIGTLASGYNADKDRPEALKELAILGKAMAARL